MLTFVQWKQQLLYFEAEYCYVAQAGLNLPSPYFCLPSAGIAGMPLCSSGILVLKNVVLFIRASRVCYKCKLISIYDVLLPWWACEQLPDRLWNSYPEVKKKLQPLNCLCSNWACLKFSVSALCFYAAIVGNILC